ncbi:MAG: hypothetical protein ACR2GH_22980 [Pseudonocardia sp.]
MVSSALRRAATAVLEGVGKRLWGFPPHLMAPVVTQLGPLRALGWFAWNMPRYERTLKIFGGVRTHLLCILVSLINGCQYCTFGHSYALELTYLRDHDRLFPLGEHAIGMLRGQQPAMIRYRLVEAMKLAELHDELWWLERTVALALTDDRRPTEPNDVRIAHLVRMFGVLNSVGVASKTAPDEAHDPLNKDSAFKQRYAGLRAAASM